MEQYTKKIGSFDLHVIKTDKFKTVNFSIIFRNEVKKEEITITNFLSSILTYSCLKYPTKNKLAIRLQDLYSARIYSTAYRVGSCYNVDFNLSMLDEKYSEKNMLVETLDTFSEILFNPNIINNAFDEDAFHVVYEEEKAQIERFKEDSRKYSVVKMLENLDNSSPFSYNAYGLMEDLDKITRENLYEFYKKFMSSSIIEIYVVGNVNPREIEKIIMDKFKFRIFKSNELSPELPYLKPRKKVQTLFENDDTNQAKLSIGCTLDEMTDYEKKYVLTIYNYIIGDSADSKFFKNIREKYSLCYYVSSFINKLDNLFIITSGITKENFSKMMILIEKEMNDMKKGEFTEEDIENAKNYDLAYLEEIEDNPGRIISYYYAMKLLKLDDIEKRKEMINKVSKKDIINVAKKIHIDTVYLLGGDKNG